MVATISGYPNRRSSAMLRTLGRGKLWALRFELGPFELGVSVALERTERTTGLGEAAEQLASTVYEQWRHEESLRQAREPFPLAVRFGCAEPYVFDHWANIRQAPPGTDPMPLPLDGQLDRIVEVYRSIPSRRLVVLGAAGSGKTILALRFVLDSLGARASGDPVPVIFGLGAWDPTATSLRDWMCGQLLRDYPGLAAPAAHGGTLADALVDADQILPVLDGFDEMASGLRRAALQALTSTATPLLLTSRPAEYTMAVSETDVLTAAAVIELDALTLEDLANYLPHASHPARDGGPHTTAWVPVLDYLCEQPCSPGAMNVAAVLTTPLMVVLASTVYSGAGGRDPAELLDTTRFTSPEALQDHLLSAFIPAVYAPTQSGCGTGLRLRWRPERAQSSLGYLALHMVRLGTRDLAWWQLGSAIRRSARMLLVGFLAALAFGVTTGIGSVLVELVGASHGLGFAIMRGLMVGLLHGLVAGLVFGLAYGFASRHAPVEPSRVRIRFFDGSRERRAKFVPRFMLGLGLGVLAALVLELADRFFLIVDLGLVDGLDGGRRGGIVFVPAIGLGAGLVLGLMAWLEAPIDIRSAVSPSGLLNSNRRIAVLQMLAWLLVLGLLAGLANGLLAGLEFGIGGAVGVGLSLTAWGQWVALSRTWLPLTGRLPWQLTAFLDDACQRGVLRQVGAVHQFRCTQLQDILAKQHLAEYGGVLAGRPQPGVPDQNEEDVKDNRISFLKGMLPWSILSAVVALLLLLSWAGTRDILEELQNHGNLGPSDAPIVVTTIVSLATAIGALVGGTLAGISKYVQARGQADAERTRADADMLRAQADMIRAKRGLPPIETPPHGESVPRQLDPSE
ncbi:NACHT domain-containing protein [Streptomyces sp. NBC_00879]|uniref:NACHT domain-containing protein n=1 Tax=Streptomyces sp. NBC_00879 TaxID=2975855 RepID=UPI003867C25A|nr:NACHT domain-containing protein [Streptomyces sp. NBC_00879]